MMMMKHKHFGALSMLLVFIFLNAVCLQAQDLERVRQLIDTLSSESFDGRGYFDKGDQKAAVFLKKKFESLGLRPFFGNYLQFFEMPINTFPGKISLKIGKTQLIPGKDFLVNAISREGKGSGELIYLDSTLFQDREVLENFLAQKIAKKVIAIRPQEYNRIPDLSQEAIKHIYSAKAILQLKNSKLVGALSNRQLSNPIFELDEKLLDSLLLSGNAPKVKFKVEAEQIPDYISQNLIAFYRGKSRPDSFLVFTAHYDHLGRMGEETFFPGANDNCSGIALLLELAHYYSDPAKRPAYSIAFMAFGAEEVGLVGSRYYVDNPLFPLSQIRFLVNLDLVGTGDEGMTVVNGSIFTKEFDLLTQLNEEHKYLPEIKSRGLAANSDHFFFTERGVPSFFFYTLGGIKAYHDVYDVSETLPLTRFEELYSLILKFVEALSNL